MCCSGQCPNCLVEVDGEPTVRACMTPDRAGHGGQPPERVAVARARLPAHGRQGDAVVRHAGRLLLQDLHPAPPAVAASTRRSCATPPASAGWTRSTAAPTATRRCTAMSTSLVIGGGESGLEAATEAASGGQHTVLVDEGLALGGQLAYGTADEMRDARRAGRGGARRGRRVPAARLRRRRLRGAAGAGLPGHDDAPLPGRRAGARHRLDRAAAGVRQQRPARHHAGRRSAPAAPTSSGIAPGGQAVVVTSGDEGIVAAQRPGRGRGRGGRGRRLARRRDGRPAVGRGHRAPDAASPPCGPRARST